MGETVGGSQLPPPSHPQALTPRLNTYPHNNLGVPNVGQNPVLPVAECASAHLAAQGVEQAPRDSEQVTLDSRH